MASEWSKEEKCQEFKMVTEGLSNRPEHSKHDAGVFAMLFPLSSPLLNHSH